MKKKNAPVHIWHTLNVYGDQTVNVSTVWWQGMYFSSGDSDMP